MITRLVISARAEKDLRTVSVHLAKKFNSWRESICIEGILVTRKISGYHDEPLQGKRFGQRSIRLNRSYRAIYKICSDEQGKFILAEEVNKHDY